MQEFKNIGLDRLPPDVTCFKQRCPLCSALLISLLVKHSFSGIHVYLQRESQMMWIQTKRIFRKHPFPLQRAWCGGTGVVILKLLVASLLADWKRSLVGFHKPLRNSLLSLGEYLCFCLTSKYLIVLNKVDFPALGSQWELLFWNQNEMDLLSFCVREYCEFFLTLSRWGHLKIAIWSRPPPFLTDQRLLSGWLTIGWRWAIISS